MPWTRAHMQRYLADLYYKTLVNIQSLVRIALDKSFLYTVSEAIPYPNLYPNLVSVKTVKLFGMFPGLIFLLPY